MKKVWRGVQNFFIVLGMMTATWGLSCVFRIVNEWTVGLTAAGVVMFLIGCIDRDDWHDA